MVPGSNVLLHSGACTPMLVIRGCRSAVGCSERMMGWRRSLLQAICPGTGAMSCWTGRIGSVLSSNQQTGLCNKQTNIIELRPTERRFSLLRAAISVNMKACTPFCWINHFNLNASPPQEADCGVSYEIMLGECDARYCPHLSTVDVE